MFPVVYSDDFLKHETGYLHPECPERLKAIVRALKAAPWHDQLNWQLPTPISVRDVLPYIQQQHSPEYIEQVRQIARQGGGMLEADTPVSPQSYDIALLAVSAWLDGVDCVLANNEPAFVLARPPGHHAVREWGMGFCIFGNAAIAAYYALENPGIERVAIVDWDVHHGNGTEALVETNPQIAYCSLHQFPAYPGTGAAAACGYYNNVLNLPLPPESTMKDYELAFEGKIMPFLGDFSPDLLIVSAGYDANQADPLASIALQPQDYGIFTRYLLKITHRILFGLEGGYDFDALAQSVVATIEPCIIM
jgi:acetoin utilization deacetylase AcuC-like enzyme